MSFRRRLMMKLSSTKNLIDYFDGYKVESPNVYVGWVVSWNGSKLLLQKKSGWNYGGTVNSSVANRTGSISSIEHTPGEASIGYESGKNYNLRIKVVGKYVKDNNGDGSLQFIFNGYDSTTNKTIKRESEVIAIGDIISGSEFNISISASDILNSLCCKYVNLTEPDSGFDSYLFEALFEFYFEEITE